MFSYGVIYRKKITRNEWKMYPIKGLQAPRQKCIDKLFDRFCELS